MTKIRTFLMMGRPGSGKGTQAKLLAEKVGGEVYSSGDRLREMADEGTFFGNKTKEVMTRGDLMPEWVSIYLFDDALIRLEPEDTIVFEGSGRKEVEAQEFHKAALWLGRPYVAVYLEAPEEVLRKRLLERAKVEGRADDAIKSIELRFKRFNEDTERSLAFFRSQGVLVSVNSDQSIEKVHAEVLSALNIE